MPQQMGIITLTQGEIILNGHGANLRLVGMRGLIVAILVFLLGLFGPSVLERFVKDVPEYFWRWAATGLVGIALLIALLSDPFYLCLKNPRVHPVASTMIVGISGALMLATIWLFAIVGLRVHSSEADVVFPRVGFRTDKDTTAAPESSSAAQRSSGTATPGAEKSTAAVSPPKAAMAVPGEIGWNFSSFLGMSGGAFDAGIPAPQFRVQTFQAFGRNIWSSTITKIEGYVEIDATGERFSLLFNKEGTPVDLGQMPPIEIDERTQVVCYFTQDRSLWNGSWQGLEPNIFLDRYTPFTFVVSINGGKERKYPFSTEDCWALIQSFMDSNKP